MGCENYSRLVREYETIMSEITSGVSRGSAVHCPATADAVNDFLRTGDVHRVTADGLTEFRHPDTVRFNTRPLAEIAHGIENCQHRVVRAVRTAEQMSQGGLTQHHYFVLFRYNSELYVADAFGEPILTTNVSGYLSTLVADSLQLASRNYDIEEVDPLAGDI